MGILGQKESGSLIIGCLCLLPMLKNKILHMLYARVKEVSGQLRPALIIDSYTPVNEHSPFRFIH